MNDRVATARFLLWLAFALVPPLMARFVFVRRPLKPSTVQNWMTVIAAWTLFGILATLLARGDLVEALITGPLSAAAFAFIHYKIITYGRRPAERQEVVT